MIELPSVLTEYGAYSPGRACHDTLVGAAAPYQAFRDSGPLPLSCHYLPKGTKLELARVVPGEAPSSTNQTAPASQPTG